jgi:hypothetical protein
VDVMHLMDAASPGYVTHEEFIRFQERLFQRMDKDRDGRVSEAEFTDAG